MSVPLSFFPPVSPGLHLDTSTLLPWIPWHASRARRRGWRGTVIGDIPLLMCGAIKSWMNRGEKEAFGVPWERGCAVPFPAQGEMQRGTSAAPALCAAAGAARGCRGTRARPGGGCTTGHEKNLWLPLQLANALSAGIRGRGCTRGKVPAGIRGGCSSVLPSGLIKLFFLSSSSLTPLRSLFNYHSDRFGLTFKAAVKNIP